MKSDHDARAVTFRVQIRIDRAWGNLLSGENGVVSSFTASGVRTIAFITIYENMDRTELYGDTLSEDIPSGVREYL